MITSGEPKSIHCLVGLLCRQKLSKVGRVVLFRCFGKSHVVCRVVWVATKHRFSSNQNWRHQSWSQIRLVRCSKQSRLAVHNDERQQVVAIDWSRLPVVSVEASCWPDRHLLAPNCDLAWRFLDAIKASCCVQMPPLPAIGVESPVLRASFAVFLDNDSQQCSCATLLSHCCRTAATG